MQNGVDFIATVSTLAGAAAGVLYYGIIKQAALMMN